MQLLSTVNHKFVIGRLQFPVAYILSQPVNEVDLVLCEIVQRKGGSIPTEELAYLLGFSIVEDAQQKRYADPAERMIFQHYLRTQQAFYLLEEVRLGWLESHTEKLSIVLTEWGKLALENQKKLLFYQDSTHSGYYFRNLSVADDFPYQWYFNLASNLTEGNSCKPAKFMELMALSLPFGKESERFQAELGKDSGTSIMCLGDGKFAGNEEVTFTCEVWQSDGQSHQIFVLINGNRDDYLTAVLADPRNREQHDAIIKQAQFQALWDDPDGVFNAETIAEFTEKWDWNTLVKDTRIDWSDPTILDAFHLQNATIWYTISQLAPVELIQEQIAVYPSLWDWSVLSKRLADEFIFETLTDELYFWDFEVLSERGSSFMAQALPIAAQKGYFPHWNLVACQRELSTTFLIDHFHPDINYDYPELQSRGSQVVVDILINAVKYQFRPPFDYTLFSNTLTADVLTRQLALLGRVIDWNVVIPMVAAKARWLFNEDEFVTALKQNAGRTTGFTLEQLEWDEPLIRLLDECSLLRWRSYGADRGFECNANIEWTLPLFNEYHSRIVTQQGRTYLSSIITSLEFIRQQPQFGWEWVQIILNDHLQIDDSLLDEFGDIVDWSILSARLPEHYIVTRLERYRHRWNWTDLSERLNVDVISYSLGAFPWDYRVLSSRGGDFLEKALRLDRTLRQAWHWPTIARSLSETSLLNILPKFAELIPEGELQQAFWLEVTRRVSIDFVSTQPHYPWEWSFLTRNTDKEFILSYLVALKDKWDWAFLTTNVFTLEEIKQLCGEQPVTTSHWDWSYLLDQSYTTESIELDVEFICRALSQIEEEANFRKAWSLLTKKVTVDFLYERLMPEDDGKLIALDWTYLSSLKRFRWESVDFINQYISKWDWKTLSRNNKVTGDYKHLRRYRQYWDWNYISEKGPFLINEVKASNIKRGSFTVDLRSRKENLQRLQALKPHVDWKALSSREDLVLDNELLDFSTEWDYGLLSQKPTLVINNDYLEEHNDKDWNWEVLSAYKNISFYDEEGKGLFEDDTLLNKPWDWRILTQREDIVITYDLVRRTKDKPWNYHSLTAKVFKDQTITRQLLGEIGTKPLDWSFLSSYIDFKIADEEVDNDKQSILDLYRDSWDWSVLSKSGHIGEKLCQSAFVERYADKWDYSKLSYRQEIAKQPDILLKLKHKPWDWAYLSGVIKAEAALLEELKDKLDWTKLSASMVINATEDLLIRYKRYWNWNSLTSGLHKEAESETYKAASRILNQDSRLLFLSRIEKQSSNWKGFLYHYAHLENAASILNDGKIKSREKASFKDTAAQQIVYRRLDPHNFARFYFRPQTPYQYFTERLGRPFGDITRREYPKCPVPIFFRLKLSEVMFDATVENHYFITNNNSHADSAIRQTIHQAVHYFEYEGVYRRFNSSDTDRDRYKKQVQQEFVVKDEIAIDQYGSLQIICANSADAKSLLNKLNSPERWIDKILVSDEDCYMNRNPSVNVRYSDNIVSVRLRGTNPVIGKIKFVVDGGSFRRIDSGKVINETDRLITVLNSLDVEINDSTTPFIVQWIDEEEKVWEIYRHKSTFEKK
ncbi:DarT ssDNA thymidine ADP-ribosyltransferase family protein [Spirosoma panaciterrae]|uniref:DarT ssDNA thymidine ADP-ribosyltransferase family protein n=1 Tax=Spirosoma panaciterrae TaxID=496058 RepID=UPI0003790CFF|nr:DarT ssDNA thymidine ADP-ribosyltransferase family protein [Spirosoma panaciterrae]